MKKALIVAVVVAVAAGGGCESDGSDIEPLQSESSQQQAGQQQGEDIPLDDIASVGEDFEYPGFNFRGLDEEYRDRVAQLANLEACPCPEFEELTLHECMQLEQRCEGADYDAALRLEAVASTAGEQLHVEVPAEDERTTRIELEDEPYRGDPDADVAIVKFSDFRCPGCQIAAEGLDEVYQQFEGDVVIYFKNLAVGDPAAEEAARAAMAADEQGRFWEMHDLLFEHQRELDESRIRDLARQLGLDMDRFERDMESEEFEDRIQDIRDEGYELDIDQSPTVFINGRRYIGATWSPDAIAEVVQEELDAQ